MVGESKTTAAIQEARICLLAGARVANSADPSDALLVLLSAPLSELHGQIFETGIFAELVMRQFGWQMSSEAIDFFVPKMRSLGWLESRSDFPARGPFYVNLPEPDIGDDEPVDTRIALEELGREVTDFATKLSPLTVLPRDPAEAGSILLRYVVDANLPATPNNEKARSDEEFICARFVEYVNKKRLPAKEIVASLSAVGYLFRVAEEIGHPSRRRKVDLRIVTDGPILLDYLGCSGTARTEASKDLFERLRSFGVATVTFQHCVDEARDALRSVLKTNPRDRYGPTGDALRKGLVSENALLGLVQGFDIAVRAGGIEILPDDIRYMPQSHKYFDENKARSVEKIVNWHDPDNENARYADSDTTVLTIRRRAGYRTPDLFVSKYVCVTTNEAFAGATRRHLVETLAYNSRQVPPVITLRELSAKLWIEIGNNDRDARLSLPNSQLLLTCERALRFNKKVVDKAREELRKVKPDQLQQFELLLEVPRSARAVMDITLNNEKYVTGGSLDSLVEAAVEAAGAEVSAKAREQRARDREKFRAELAEAEQRLLQERSNTEKQEEDAKYAKAQAAEAEARVQAVDAGMLEAVEERANSQFGRLRSIIRIASVLVAFAPLIVAALAIYYGTQTTPGLLLAIITAALAGATAMDRPGAWLSKVLQTHLASRAEASLRNMGRYDLASEFELSWVNGRAVVQRLSDGSNG